MPGSEAFSTRAEVDTGSMGKASVESTLNDFALKESGGMKD